MITPFGRIKDLVSKIQVLEGKLTSAGLLPMAEQHKIHLEIQRHKKEMLQLEQHTRR